MIRKKFANTFLTALFLTALLRLPTAAEPPPLTEEAVKNLMLSWFAATNDHRPVEELLPYLTDDVEMRYPDAPAAFVGKDAFRKWYASALSAYFDETHKVEFWNAKVDGQRASVELVVRWERRMWKAGEARSRYEASLSRQVVEVVRSPVDGGIKICKKAVVSFDRTAPVFDVGR